MDDAGSFDAVLQCNLLEIFCEGLGAALFVTDKLDQVTFASVRLLHFFPMPESAIRPGVRARDLYGALFDAGCRFGMRDQHDTHKEDWVSDRVANGWRERVDRIERGPGDRWFHCVSRRFSSGLGLTVLQDVSEHKKKERNWLQDRERIRLTEEILDALPIGIAVKDRNLNYAAVNQQFCSLLGIKPEQLLGKTVWEVYEPSTARFLEEANWRLLGGGEDQRYLIDMQHTDGAVTRVLQRTRRIGPPGQHYLVMTFETPPESAAPPDLFTNSQTLLGAETPDGDEAAEEVAATPKDPLRIVYATAKKQEESRLVLACRHVGADLCIIRTANELQAFLPAIRDAGLRIDLLVLDDTAVHFAGLAADYALPMEIVAHSEDLPNVVAALRSQKTSAPPEQPQTPLLPVATPEPAPQPLRPVDVLGIEDNAVNLMALEQMLDSLGLNFATAKTGAEALQMLETRRPQIVLADTTLPDMDLPAFMTAARKTPAGAALTYIAMAAPASAKTREDYQAQGLCDLLHKPLGVEAIDAMLRRYMFAQRAPAAISMPAA